MTKGLWKTKQGMLSRIRRAFLQQFADANILGQRGLSGRSMKNMTLAIIGADGKGLHLLPSRSQAVVVPTYLSWNEIGSISHRPGRHSCMSDGGQQKHCLKQAQGLRSCSYRKQKIYCRASLIAMREVRWPIHQSNLDVKQIWKSVQQSPQAVRGVVN